MCCVSINTLSLQKIIHCAVTHVELVGECAHGRSWRNKSLLYHRAVLFDVFVYDQLTAFNRWSFKSPYLLNLLPYTGRKLGDCDGGHGLEPLALFLFNSANSGSYTPLSPTLRLISRNIVVRSTCRTSPISLKSLPS